MNKQFNKMNIRGGGVQASRGPNQGTTETDKKSTVLINMFPVKCEKNIPIYKYDVKITITFPSGQEKELTTEGFDTQRIQCTAIISHIDRTEGLGDYAYNRAACLYCLSLFENKEFTLNVTDIPELAAAFDAGTLTVKIDQGPQKTFQVSTNDLLSCIPGRPGYQPNLLEALNLILEREAFSRPDQWFSRNAIHYQTSNTNAVDLKGGVILKPGLKTSAEVVGDSPTTLRLVVAADIKAVVQHLPMTLDQKIDALMKIGCHDLNSALFGISVVPTYGQRRIPFTIQTVNQQKSIKQVVDGKTMDNVQYFKTTYGITLRRSDLPMVGKRSNKAPTGYIFYPAEVLMILPNQSVPKELQIESQLQRVQEYSVMLPNDRLNLCYDYMRRLGLFNNQNLLRFGFELGTTFMEVPCKILSGVQVNGYSPRDNVKVNYRDQKFFVPPVIDNWAVINYGCDANSLNEFRDWMRQSLTSRGVVKMPPPAEINISSDLPAEQLLKKCKDNNFKFVFIALGDKIEIHDDIKYYEQKYQVCTQIVKASLIRKVIEKGQGNTVDNILLKLCLKNGGIPYKVETSKGDLKIITNDVLYIGVAFSHQQGTGGASRRFKKRPSRLGYAATCSDHPNKVIGDWIYLEGHNNEKAFDAIVKIIGQCKATFVQNRKVVPKTVVLYLNGYSEGQWAQLKAEVPNAKAVLGATKLILILENKKTAERLYKTERSGGSAQETNIPAGLCLDSGVITPGCKGFYLNSHQILKGTACSPKYSILVNEPAVSLDSIEYATHALTFLHSVCTSATSEVAVLTVADRCAKRGQTVLNYHMKRHNMDEITVEDANQELTNPLNGRLHSLRFNA